MATNGDIVSRVSNVLRGVGKDTHISRRLILKTAKEKCKYLLAQKLLDNTVYREDNLLRWVRCFEMEEDDVVSCNIVQFKRCEVLMKSKNKLPEMLYSRWGNSITCVVSLDGMTTLSPLSSKNTTRKRMYAEFDTDVKYYVQDGYLYIPDQNIEVVDVQLIPADESEVDELSGCEDCDSEESECKSVWDYEFICPDKLREIVIQETISELAQTYMQIPPDETPNLNENEK